RLAPRYNAVHRVEMHESFLQPKPGQQHGCQPLVHVPFICLDYACDFVVALLQNLNLQDHRRSSVERGYRLKGRLEFRHGGTGTDFALTSWPGSVRVVCQIVALLSGRPISHSALARSDWTCAWTSSRLS